ncbi:Lactadherin [Holothuria leucospilota]|uniref:Lactadherin n=1 Tax=Holothuria leucospilota TaxID=206669 RepID=A0A9Q1C6Y3_HOLLE|nr:Lactadherin [Holothuria leucospilota]
MKLSFKLGGGLHVKEKAKTYLFELQVTLVDFADSDLYCTEHGQQEACCKRFGLNVNRDSNILLTASSSYDNKHKPDRAALFEIDTYSEPSGGIAGWATATNNVNQWIQVDFGSPRQVTGILLQGRGESGYHQWVTSFRVLFSDDAQVFYSTAVIEGTFDHETVARRFFDRPIVARYFRINPVTWFGHITLRFDLLGCDA